MFNFANPEYIYLFIIIPIIILLYWLNRKDRTKKLNIFGNVKILEHLMPDASKYIHGIKITLYLIAMFSLIIMIMRPRSGEKEQIVNTTGSEIFVALDVSNSMLASSTDDPNGTSRLDKAKLLLEKLFEKLKNEKVGLIVFAGDAYLQLPLTTDIISAKQYLDIISTDMVSTQGTAIADAIELAMNAYTSDEMSHKGLILITDSEDHIGEAVEMAKNAEKQNIQINVIGLGTANGAPIPLDKDKTRYFTNNGEIVKTALNVSLAKDIANAGKGIFVNGASNSALVDIANQLEKLSKSELKTHKYKSTAEQFTLFAWIALVILVIDAFIPNKKISWLKKINFFSK